jgi:hypothetical protein
MFIEGICTLTFKSLETMRQKVLITELTPNAPTEEAGADISLFKDEGGRVGMELIIQGKKYFLYLN